MKIEAIICLLLLCCSTPCLYGQAQRLDPGQYVDVVKLNGGVEFRGKIVNYLHGKFVLLELPDGHQLNFAMRDVRKITQEYLDAEGKPFPKPKRAYNFEEQGLYGAFSAGLIGGTTAGSGHEENVLGTELSAVVGRQFNRWVGLGLGLGADYYYPGAGEGIFPLFAEVKGYLTRSRISPYYSVAAGYGFAFKNEERNIVAARGGLMFHPAMGLRLGASENVNFTVQAGLKFQRADFTHINNLSWGIIDSRITNRMNFKRFSFSIGLIF